MNGKYTQLPAIAPQASTSLGNLQHHEASFYGSNKNNVDICLEVQKAVQLPAIERPEHVLYLQKLNGRRRHRNDDEIVENKRKMKGEKQESKTSQIKGKNSTEKNNRKVRFLSPLHHRTKTKINDRKKAQQKMIREKEKRDIERLNEISKRIRDIGKLKVEPQQSEAKNDDGNVRRKNENNDETKKILAIFVPH